ncbi:N-acetylmuramoyl-L-alanine amidase [Prevotella dentasini]
MVKKIFLLFVLSSVFLLAPSCAKGKFTLVIDAGHGGHDTGAVGVFSQEKNINLKVALAFGRYVEQNLPEVRVIYTRRTDVFIPLHERAGIANRAKADLFISVHTNSVPAGHSSVAGFQVYTLGMHRAKDNLDVAMRENSVISLEKGYQQTYQGFDPKSSESYIMFEFMQNANMSKSIELAKLIQRSVCGSAHRADKGVHQAGFLVLRETSMPSCLIELGFISNDEEEQFLNSDMGVEVMSRGIYEAFVQYKNMYDDHLVLPYRGANNRQISVGRVLPSSVEVAAPARQSLKPVKVSSPAGRTAASAKSAPAQPSGKKKEQKPKAQKSAAAVSPEGPIFKVQIFAVNRQLRPGSEQFKGHKDAVYFMDGDMFKYTIGESQDYNEMVRLRNKLNKDFPQAFVVAFKKGRRINTSEAIAEYVKNKKTKAETK